MTIRVGFIGAGFIARYHAHQLHSCRVDHDIVAVYDSADHRRNRFAEAERAISCEGPAQVVEASDVVFVCTWTSEHLPMVRLVCDAGKALFCEKPLSTDLTSAAELVDVVESAGVANMVGLVLRTSPALLTMRELIRDHRSGRVMNVVFRDDQYIPTQGMYRSSWRGDRERAGSGTLLEHSIHDLDILEWLVGDARTVAASTANFHGIDGIEDSVAAVLRFGGGHSATVTSVWHDVLARPSQRRMEVFCERALVTLEGDATGPVTWQRDDEQGLLEGDAMISWLRERRVDLRSAETQMLSAVAAGDVPPPPSVRDALRAHVLVDAVYRSAASNGAVVSVEQ